MSTSTLDPSPRPASIRQKCKTRLSKLRSLILEKWHRLRNKEKATSQIKTPEIMSNTISKGKEATPPTNAEHPTTLSSAQVEFIEKSSDPPYPALSGTHHPPDSISDEHSMNGCAGTEPRSPRDDREPSLIDRSYRMRDNTDLLVATASDVQELSLVKNVEATSRGAFRRVCVLYDGDPTNKKAMVQCVLHDTGSGYSLTFKGKLDALKMKYQEFDKSSTDKVPVLQSVTGQLFTAIGFKQIRFRYYGVPDKDWFTNLVVLEDPKEDQLPAFDILLGRDFLLQANALLWNTGVIGTHNVRIASGSQYIPTLAWHRMQPEL